MKNVICLMIFLAIAVLSAGAQPNKKVGPALTKFLNTEFMIKFRDLRIAAESAALSAQSNQGNIKQSDVFRLRSAYDQTASRANQLLSNIKQDFLNDKKLKSIAEFPEMYSDGLRYKLQELSDFYSANFQQVLADASVSQEDVDGSAVLLLVVELISLTKGLTNYFNEIKREARQYTDAHLQENLVMPYRWRYWDEMTGSVSPYEKFEKSSELETPSQTNDQLDQHLYKVNEAVNNLPAKNQNNNFNTEGTGNTDFNPAPEGDVSQDTGNNIQYDDWTPDATPPADSTGTNPSKPLKTQKKAPTDSSGKTQKAPVSKSGQ